MKQLIVSLSIISCLMVISCNKSIVPLDEPSKITLSFSMGGEINTTDLPMTKVDNNNDLYAIQIDYYPSNSTTTVHYAYGFFSDLSAASLEVYTNTKYVVKAYCIKGWSDDNSAFHVYTENASGGATGVPMSLLNAFEFASNKYIMENSQWNNNNKDCFYGEIEKTVSSESTVTIEMIRCLFGLKLVAENLNKGSLKVEIGEYLFNLSPDNSTIEGIYLFKGWAGPMAACYSRYIENGEHSQNYTVKVIYIDESGKQSVIATETVTFIRNKKKLITITLKNTIPDEVNAAFNFSLDSQGMTDDSPVRITQQ